MAIHHPLPYVPTTIAIINFNNCDIRSKGKESVAPPTVNMDAVPPAAPSGAPPPPQQPAVPPAPPARPPPPPPPAAAYEGGNGDSSGAADGKEDSRGGDTRNGERSKEFDGEPHGPTVGGLDLHLQVQHGVICILGYMAVGVLAYSFGLEGWG